MKNGNESSFANDFQTQFGKSKTTEGVGDLTIGIVIDISSTGSPLIDYPGNSSNSPVPALATVDINQASIGRQVAILFANGDLTQPVVIGLIRNMVDSFSDNEKLDANSNNKEIQNLKSIDVKVDEENLVFSAKNQVTFKCGKASITLTKAGKVIISGEYVISKSTGVNSLKGGSIQLN